MAFPRLSPNDVRRLAYALKITGHYDFPDDWIITTGQDWFFHHVGTGNPPGYEGFERIPADSTEDDESVTVNSVTSPVLIDKYITNPGEPGTTTIKAGIWYFDCFHYVDNSVGVTQFRYTVKKYALDTTETTLFSVDSAEVNALVATEFTTTYAQAADITLLTSDRLVVYVYALTTSVPNRTAHFVYEGTSRASHVHSTVGIEGVAGTVGPQGPAGRISMVLCAGDTPGGTGAWTVELPVPYDSDGTSAVTYDVVRATLRVQVAGGAPSVNIEKSTVAGVFSATVLGTVTLGSGAYEASVTAALGQVSSGNKLRMNVQALGTATLWTVTVELSPT